MNLKCDLHIHTALSPCGDDDMTPNNIVNMSLLNELDVIAITDHNTMGNAAAVMAAAEGTELLVLPGMEIETSEEIHLVALFDTLAAAQEMGRIVRENLPPIRNRPKIFGRQLLLDWEDCIVGEEDQLLLTASSLGIYEAVQQIQQLGGAAIPAHVNRDSYSILSSLGQIPPDLNIKYVELSKKAKIDSFSAQYPEILLNYRQIVSSDAHYLADLDVTETLIKAPKKSAKDIICKLC